MAKLVDKKAEIARWGFDLEDALELDDWSSQWKECLEGRAIWGGRTLGGRGVQKITGRTKDISVEGVALSFCGKELLQRTTLRFVANHRYGIVGENGVGKSTLLRRIAKQAIPGIPLHFRFGFVQQELPLTEDMVVLDYIMKGVAGAGNLEEQLEKLHSDESEIEALMENTTDNEEMSNLAEQLCEIAEQLEQIEALIAKKKQDKESKGDKVLTRADIEALGPEIVKVLDGLGLSKPPKRLALKLSELSGGWRMRASLAQCLCNIKSLDVLLLDEPTNHLDLPTIAWLQDYLASLDVIIVFVSHDRSFLNHVATDIIEMKDLGLHYFPGTYDDWLIHKDEMKSRKMNALDAVSRKEAHIQKSIDQAHSRGDDKQAKSKAKKLDRASFVRSLDGHKFKLFSLSKLDEAAVHMPESVEGEREKDFRLYKFKFPVVDPLQLRLPTPNSPLLTLDKCTLAYQGKPKPLLNDITLQLTLQSRVGIIGRNGKGKTTLLNALAFAETVGPIRFPSPAKITSETRDQDDAKKVSIIHPKISLTKGKIWRHHNLRIGMVSQHQIDILSEHLWETPLTYVTKIFALSSESTTAIKESEVRAHLGAFGISGNLALQKIGSLSGGQKARLSFAVVCACKPHLLFLDEPSNHLSLDAIEGLISACKEFTGGIVLVSHNRQLIGSVCKELYCIQGESMVIRRVDGEITNEEEFRDDFNRLLENCIKEQLRTP